MEYTFKELKKKCVINVADGKKLGKITDIKITFPQNCVKSFFAENCFSLCGEKYEISVCDVKKIGSDAILVDFSSGNKTSKNGAKAAAESSYAARGFEGDEISDDESDE